MNKRQFYLRSALTMCLAGKICAVEPTKSSPRYNVLLIMVDDLNDWTGFLHGHPQVKTPNMDELAKMGMVFDRAYSAVPLCNPSRTAMLTGLRASTTGVYDNEQNFSNSSACRGLITLPQYFSQHGYETIARGKIYHKPDGPMAHAETWDQCYPYEGSRMGSHLASIDRENKILAGGLPYQNNSQVEFDWGPVQIEDDKTSDFMAAQWAARELQKRHENLFFLAVGIFRPHLPFYVPQKYFDMYPPAKDIIIPEIDEQDLDDISEAGKEMSGGLNSRSDYQRLKTAGLQHDVVRGYLAAISYADACVGEVLKGLKNSPYLDNTIVILAGDNGWHFGEKLHYRKATLWDRACHVPLIVRVPGTTRPGSRCQRVVNLLDIYPTLASVCEFPANPRNEGRSFSPLLSAPQTAWPYPTLSTMGYKNHTVVDENYRYIQYADGSRELYDVSRDRNEKNNLAGNGEYQDVVARLERYLPSTNCLPILKGFEVVPAGEIRWTGLNEGEWNVGKNWSIGRVPADTDDVIIRTKDQLQISSYTAAVHSVELQNGNLYIHQSGSSLLDVSGNFIQADGVLQFRTAGNVHVGGNYVATGGTVKILQGSDAALTVDGDLNFSDNTLIFTWNNSMSVRSILVGGTTSLNRAKLAMSSYKSSTPAGKVLLIGNSSTNAVTGGFSGSAFETTTYDLGGTDYVLTLDDRDGDGIKNDIYLVPKYSLKK